MAPARARSKPGDQEHLSKGKSLQQNVVFVFDVDVAAETEPPLPHLPDHDIPSSLGRFAFCCREIGELAALLVKGPRATLMQVHEIQSHVGTLAAAIVLSLIDAGRREKAV